MKLVLASGPAVVTKNSSWDVSDDFKDNKAYSHLVGGKAQSIQISDGKQLYKLGLEDGKLDGFPFGMNGKLTIVFESAED